jgi:hypothetical protein
MWGALAGLAVVVGPFGTGCGPDTTAGEALALTNVRVIPMDGDGPYVIEDGVVLVRDGVIEAVGASTLVPVSRGARVIDGRGGYVVPGLVDMHVHVREEAELALYVAAGITTVRNMNGNFGEPLLWRRRIEAGDLLGPRFVTSGPTLFDGNPEYRWHVASPQHARELARTFKDDGFDLIKVYHLEEPTYLALADEAAQLGLPVAGHYPVPAGELDVILSSGMSSIEHLDELVLPAFNGRSDYERIPDVVEAIRTSGVTIGTILAQWESVGRGLDDPAWLTNDSLVATAIRYFGDEGKERLEGMAADFETRDQASIDADKSDFEFLFALLRALADAGVPIVASTDAHQVLAPAGDALFNELELFVRAGLSAHRTLRSVTVTPAVTLGLSDRLGTLAPGMSADLVLLANNPLERIGALRSPRGVMLRGAWLGPEALDSLRASALPGRD